MNKEESWALVKAIPDYYYDEEESPNHMILTGDTWCWACADCVIVTDNNVERIAELYNNYGLPGIYYYQGVELGEYSKSEFEDVNRFVEFVKQEEQIKKDCPDFSRRAYFKKSYTLGKE